MRNTRSAFFLSRLASGARRARARAAEAAAPARSLISELDEQMLRDLALAQAAVRGRRP
jgi:hypothetical protein